MAKRDTAKSYSVTSAGINPVEDRRHRSRIYYLSMLLRALCVLSLLWVHGWWVLLPMLGAIFLPWFAVLIANAVAQGGETQVAQPPPLQLATSESSCAKADPELLVIDVEPQRRGKANPSAAAPPTAEDLT